MAKIRGSMFIPILLAAAFAVTLIVLYPEWRKLADTTSEQREASPTAVRLNGQATQTARSAEQRRHEPLENVWSFQTKHRWQYRDPFLKRAIDQIGGMICSDVVVAHNRVYFGSEGGFIYCLSLDGKPIWSFETLGAKTGTPLVTEDRLFCGSEDNYLYCISPEGKPVWKFETGDYVESTPVVVAGGKVYLCAEDHYFYSVGGMSPSR